ncbi:MAG: accessory gene regulator B family protein [Defluviitaleaceae bacterium]|nr:accessory gene regulator B family protein [Defluviitaleaceae bacterium]
MVGKMVGYAEANMELSRYDSAKLRFMLEVIYLLVVQLSVYAAFFAAIGRLTEFAVAMGVLMSIRPFSGGLHFKKYRYCFVLSFAILAAVILVLPDISNTFAMESLLVATILLNIALSPVSKRNAAHSAKSNFIFKVVSTVILLAYSAFLLTTRDNPYVSIVTWMLFIQSAQLIIGKMMLHARTKEQ